MFCLHLLIVAGRFALVFGGSPLLALALPTSTPTPLSAPEAAAAPLVPYGFANAPSPLRPPDAPASAPPPPVVDTMGVMSHTLYANRLVAYHPNYGVIAADHGESRLQFQISVQYELLQYPAAWWKDRWAYYPKGFNLSYDGLYDFYWFSRDSSPVLSRDQNPGFFVHFVPHLGRRLYHADFWDAGWFHESNGQTTVNTTQYSRLYAEMGDQVQDTVHRGWDYWYAGTRFSAIPFDDPETGTSQTATKMHSQITVLPSLRFYDGHQGIDGSVSQNVFWKPAGVQPTIYDYDGLRLSLNWTSIFPDATVAHFNLVELSFDVRTGYNFGAIAANWSKRVALTVKTGDFPWYIYYFNGYGPYISDYTTWSQGWGMGIRLW